MKSGMCKNALSLKPRVFSVERLYPNETILKGLRVESSSSVRKGCCQVESLGLARVQLP